jgi:cation diffusion facilitator family transporter
MTSSEACDHDPSRVAGIHPGPDTRQRARGIRKVFLITLALNALVALTKGLYSYVSGSVALGADTVHSALDASSNILALLGLHWASAPADSRHPYGRRKVEILAALGIGALIVFGLFEFAAASLQSIWGGRPPPQIGWAGFVVVLSTMGVNTFVARYEERKGHELHSALLCADAHHTRSDIYASAAVLVSFIAIKSGIGWADGVGGLVLVVLVGRVAWMVFKENVPSLIDAAMLDPSGVIDLAGSVEGVHNIHRVRSRGVKSAVELDLHMQVAPQMTVEEAHKLATQIERELRVKFPEVSDVVIHIEPTAAAAAAITDPTRPK